MGMILRFKDLFFNRLSLFLFFIIIFALGSVFGVVALVNLPPSQRGVLVDELSTLFQGLEGAPLPDSLSLLKGLAFDHLVNLAMIWFLGLSVVGSPLIMLLLFLRGFVLGFTVGFLIHELFLSGVFFALAALAPHQLIIIPVTITAAVTGASFALMMVRKLAGGRRLNYLENLLGYTTVFLALSTFLLLASLIEALVSPFLLEVVSRLIL